MLKALDSNLNTVGVIIQHRCSKLPRDKELIYEFGSWVLRWSAMQGDSDMPPLDYDFEYINGLNFCPYCGKELK